MARLGNLYVSLQADTAAFSSGLAKARGDLSSTSAHFNRGLAAIDKSFAGLGGSIKNFGAGLFSLKGAVGALVGIGAGSGLVAMAKQAADSIGAIGELADQLGISTDSLQAFQYAATQVGLSQQELETGIARLTKTVGEAATGNKAAIDSFERFGIKILDARGNVRSTDDVLRDIADAMQAIDDPAKRAALATDLLGKAGQKLIPFLQEGAAGIDAFIQQARDMGVVLDRETIAKADEASDKIAALSQVLTIQFNAALVELAPLLSAAADGFSRFAKEARLFWESLQSDSGRKSTAGLLEDLDNVQRRLEKLQSDKALQESSGLSWIGDLTGANASQDKSIAEAKSQIAILQALIRARRDAIDPLASSTGYSNPAVGGGGETTKAKTAAIKEQTSALDELLASMAQELQLSKETDRQRAISEALIRASAAAQRDYDAGLRDSPLVDPATVERIKAATGALFDQSQAQREVASWSSQASTAVADATKATERYESALADLGGTFASAFEEAALSMDEAGFSAKSLGNVLEGLLKDIERIILRVAVSDPIAEGLTGLLKGISWSSIFGGGGQSAWQSTSGNPHVGGGGGGGFFDWIGGLFGFAGGGDVKGKQPIIVGEKGPEVWVPPSDGFIIPNHRIGAAAAAWSGAGIGGGGGGGGDQIVQIIDQRGSGQIEQRESTGPNGEKMMQFFIVDTVAKAMGRGQLDKPLGTNYGIKRKPGRSG